MLDLNPFQLLERIVGIGPALAKALEDRGFVHDIDLLALPEIALISDAAQIDGLSASMIAHSVLPQARLLRLPGSNGSVAQRLVEAGFRRYSDFLGIKTTRIETLISTVDVDDDEVPRSRLACEMLLTAVQLAVTGGVRIVVVDGETREPLPGAAVTYGGDRRRSETVLVTQTADERGIVDFEGIAPYPTAFRVSADGFSPLSVLAVVEQQRHVVCTALMSTEPRMSKNHDEFLGGLAVGFSSLPVVRQRTELSELPSRPPVNVEEVGDGEATLGSLWFRENSDRVMIPILKIPASDLPDDAKANDVLLPSTDGWRQHPDGVTAAEFRQTLMRERRSKLHEEAM